MEPTTRTAERRIEREQLGIPRSAAYLGTDDEQFDHYHAAVEGRVWVVDADGEPHIQQDLGGRSVWEWVGYVEDEHGGWAELNLEREGGLAGLAGDLVDAVDGDEAEKELVTDGGRTFVDDRAHARTRETEQAQLVADVSEDQQTLDGDDASQRSLFGASGGDGR